MKAWNQIFPASVEPENSKAETNSAETSSPNRVQRQSQSFSFSGASPAAFITSD